MSDSTREPQQEFAATLLNISKGLAHDKASALLTQAVAAVKEQGKAAELVMKVRIEPVKNNSRVVQITAATAAKIPQAPIAPTIFFADDEGGLHRNDPEQRELDYTAPATSDGKSAAAGRD